MGNSNSSLFGEPNTSDAIVNLYRKYVTGTVSGGAEANIKDYPHSLMSAAKQQLIKNIARDLSAELKVSKIDPAGKTIDAVIADLKQFIPDPRPGGNKKTWSSKEGSQVNACKALGRIINKNMQETIINESAKPGEICEQVSEIMYSLFTGMQTEFIGVKISLERALKNIHILMDILDKQHKSIEEQIGKHEDTGEYATKTAALRDMHHEVARELHRQVDVLQNLLDITIKPADVSLAETFKNVKELKSLVGKIKQHPGTEKFSNKISYALTGMVTIADAAKIIDNALSKLGLSLGEYAKASTPKELNSLMSDLMTKKFATSTLDQMAKYQEMVEILYNMQYLHDDVVAELRKKGGDASALITGSGSPSPVMGGREHHHGGAPAAGGGAKIDKRIKKRQDLKKLMVREFSRRLSDILDGILAAAKSIGDAIGTGAIPLTDVLERFPKALELIPEYQSGAFFSLSGYFDDIRSREERTRYVSTLRHVIASLDDIVKDQPKHAAFRDMRKGFQDIVNLIETFSSRFQEEFGAGASVLGDPAESVTGSGQLMPSAHGAAVIGGHEGSLMGGDDMKDVAGGDAGEISRVAYQLSDLKTTILYKFRTARIRVNLATIAGENRATSEAYTKVSADAIAGAIDLVQKRKNEISKRLDPPSNDALLTALGGDKTKLEPLFKLHLQACEAEISMYNVAETVDNYMKNFADGIVADPDAVNNIMSILNNTEIISQWYTDKTGDRLCQIFDAFPASYDGVNPLYSYINEASTNSKLASEHYYVRVAAACRLGNLQELRTNFPSLFGNAASWAAWQADIGLKNPAQAINGGATDPSLPGISLLSLPNSNGDNGTKLLDLTRKFLTVSVLKNIVAIFVTVGSRFGNTDVANKTPLSPAQLYRQLNEYMAHSAFAAGMAIFDSAGTSAGALDAVDLPLGDTPIPTSVAGNDKSFHGNFLRTGITANDTLPAANDNIVRRWSAFGMRSVDKLIPFGGAGAGVPYPPTSYGGNPYNDQYQQTDLLFTLVLKSMVAKIFTVIGVFNMFNRPIQKSGLGYNNVLRSVLGGAASDVPKVVPEALELYIRLPLLAEFYRRVLDFDKSGVNATATIAMLPEIDGVYSELIAVIFDRAKYVNNGVYSEVDLRMIIEAVNKIWMAFKSAKNPVSEAIHGLVTEVNRRIGLYNAQERDAYNREKEDLYADKYESVNREDVTDYELAGIDEDYTSLPPNPSAHYRTEGSGTNKLVVGREHKYKLEPDVHRGYINNLRNTIDSMFNAAQAGLSQDMDTINTRFTFEHIITARGEELKHANTDLEKFRIVTSAVSNLGEFSHTALEKSFILFHEKVVAPLATLTSLYTMLKNFNDSLNGMYVGLKRLSAWSKSSSPNFIEPGTNAGLNSNGNPGILNSDHAAYNFLLPFLHDTDYDGASAPGNATMYAVAIRTGSQGQGPVAGVNVAGAAAAPGHQGATYNNLQALVAAAGNAGATPGLDKFLYRFAISQDKLANQLIELLYGHAGTLDDLVSLHVESAHDPTSNKTSVSITLDHSAIRQHVYDLLDDIKKSISTFRSLLPKDIIDRYELYRDDYKGSAFWLEKHFVDELLGGKYSTPIRDPPELPRDDNLDRSTEKVRYIIDYLTTSWDFNARGIFTTAAGAAPAIPADFTTLQRLTNNLTWAPAPTKTAPHEFASLLNNLVFYDVGPAYTLNWSSLTSQKSVNDQGITRLLFNTGSKTRNGVPAGSAWKKADIVNGLYDPVRGFNDRTGRSVWLEFNQLVALYISQMYDSSTNRIYINTINGFVNGEFSSAVFSDNNYDDSAMIYTDNILNGTDNANHSAKGVLLRSLATILHQLFTEKNEGSEDKKRFLEQSLDEIPLYVKEKWRAQLPIFAKLFKYLIKRCELLKTFTHILNIERPVGKNALFPAAGNINAPARGRDDAESIITGVLDQIITGCTSIMQCIHDTHKELSDSPKFMETHAGFITEYESLNGKYPFMPPSSILYFLRTESPSRPNDANGDLMLPFYSMGDNRFKLEYGTRGILNMPKPSLSELPSLARFIRDHNQSTDTKYHFDEKSTAAAVSSYLSLARYMIDARSYRSLFSVYYKEPGANTGIPAGPSGADKYGHAHMQLVSMVANDYTQTIAPYSLLAGTTLADVIRLTENTQQREQRGRVIATVEKVSKLALGRSRDDMIIYNIIDLNLVPINFNALRREIPLIHLYNYSYSFDCYIAELLNVQLADLQAAVKGGLPPTSIDAATDGRLTLARLLVDPYAQISDEDYDFRVDKIMRGNLGIEGLGRPKFLADTVYNKALFGEVYAGENFYEEGGPGSGDGRQHGVQSVVFGDSVRNQYFSELLGATVFHAMSSIFDAGAAGGYGALNAADLALLRPVVINYVKTIVAPNGLRKNPTLQPNVYTAHRTNLANAIGAAVAGINASVQNNLSYVIVLLTEIALIRPSILDNAAKYMRNGAGAIGESIFKLRGSDPVNALATVFRSSYDAAGPNYLGRDNRSTDMVNHGNAIGDMLGGGNPPDAWATAYRAPVDLGTLGAARAATPEQQAVAQNLQTILSGMVRVRPDQFSRGTRSATENANRRFFDPALHYLAVNQNGEGEVKHVNVNEFKPLLQQIGKLRFDTILVRNIFWLSNLQRIIRLGLRRNLEWFDEKVVSKHAVTAPAITEFYGNNM